MKIFSPDGKLYGAMVKLTDAVKISLLWLLLSVPLVTFGASTIAAYTVLLRFVKDEEGNITQDFFKAFKANLKQGIPMSFITILCAWAIYLDFQLFSAATQNNVIFLIIGVIAAYVFVFSLLYAYPLFARYENTILRTIHNSFRISMRYFLRSVGAVLLVAFELALFFFNTHTLILGFFFGGAVVMGTISRFAVGIFEDIEKKNGEQSETE